MIRVRFYENDIKQEENLKYVVIVAKYKNKWVMVRHRDRNTWEVPGGHIEKGESKERAAKRELYEETGAIDFKLTPINIYSVSIDNGDESFGALYYAEVFNMEKLPDSEIEEVITVDNFLENLTYPQIQPFLWKKAIEFMKNCG